MIQRTAVVENTPTSGGKMSARGVRCVRWLGRAAALFAVLLAIPTTADAAAAGWTFQPTSPPAGAVIAQLTGVSCPTVSFCLAVGTDGHDASAAVYAISDGRTWSPERELVPAGATSAALYSVSCLSRSQCVAVGSYVDSTEVSHPLAEQWDGARWSRESVPVAGTGEFYGLYGVDCVTANSCVAVGSTSNGPIADYWNGMAWASQTVAGSSIRGELLGVSCRSGTSCVAVGSQFDAAGHRQPSAALLSGSTWTLHSVPSARGADSSDLASVSCPVSGDCVAVGEATNGSAHRAFSTEWDGSSWTEHAVPVPAVASSAYLAGVSCASATVCTAVGSYGGVGVNGPLADRWNGSSWILQPMTGPAAPEPFSDYSVSCPATLLCTAVGVGVAASGDSVPLAEVWGGPAWAALSIPSPPTMKFAQLFGTSCASVDWCMAVGQYDRSSDGAVVAFAEFWNGSGWRILEGVPLPAGAGNATLLGVSCPLVGECVAVGSYTRLADRRVLPLVVGWNRGWTSIPAGNPGGAHSQLDGVWCESIGSCEAVGFRITSTASGLSVPLAELVSGTSASVQRVPQPPQNAGSALHGVHCNFGCVAVGNWDQGHGEMALSYVLPLSGAWRMTSNPNDYGPGAGENDLFGVSCETTSCLAVGGVQFSNEMPLAQSRDASAIWRDVSPGPPGQGAFKAISCPATTATTATTACIAVGYRTTSTRTLTLAERWDGFVWTTQNTPSPSTDNILYGVDCPTVETCIAVGTIANQHTPLAEIYS